MYHENFSTWQPHVKLVTGAVMFIIQSLQERRTFVHCNILNWKNDKKIDVFLTGEDLRGSSEAVCRTPRGFSDGERAPQLPALLAILWTNPAAEPKATVPERTGQGVVHLYSRKWRLNKLAMSRTDNNVFVFFCFPKLSDLLSDAFSPSVTNHTVWT